MSKLRGVSDTLFIPLAARVFVSKKFPEYFFDEKALLLEKYIPSDAILKKSSEYSFIASVARYYNLDSMIKAFISKNAKSNIVYLGAGFETAYYRLNDQIFDATNKTGIKYANKYVKKTGNADAPVYFYIDDSVAFSKRTETTLIEERVFFTEARKILAKRLKLYTKIAMKIVDNKKRAMLLRLRIN